MTRGKGLGFFEAGNFYPDFILWLLVGERQYVTFIDPMGLRSVRFWTTGEDGFARYHALLQQADRAAYAGSILEVITGGSRLVAGAAQSGPLSRGQGA